MTTETRRSECEEIVRRLWPYIDGGLPDSTSKSIDSFVIGAHGSLGAPVNSTSSGLVPFGFDYAPNGLLVVSEAGSAAASSYKQAWSGSLTPVSQSVSTSRSLLES